jgi:murein DD-endopeptidase MepM/ murein hydrolase activator NlpD
MPSITSEAPISGAEPALVSEPTPPPVPPVLAQPAAAPLPPASASFIWPVAGSVNSQFGPRWGGFHSGIDIGAPYGTAVGAAAGGQVVLTVYSDVGFGYHVVIRHDDGSETLYAHLSAIYVGLGQYVAQGEAIGAVGCTGWCTGNHLHFEVHIGGTPVNPLLYLP